MRHRYWMHPIGMLELWAEESLLPWNYRMKYRRRLYDFMYSCTKLKRRLIRRCPQCGMKNYHKYGCSRRYR